MIKIEFTPNEAVWIFQKLLQERTKALPLLAKVKMLEESNDPEDKKVAEDFNQIQNALRDLTTKVKTALADHFDKKPDEK